MRIAFSFAVSVLFGLVVLPAGAGDYTVLIPSKPPQPDGHLRGQGVGDLLEHAQRIVNTWSWVALNDRAAKARDDAASAALQGMPVGAAVVIETRVKDPGTPDGRLPPMARLDPGERGAPSTAPTAIVIGRGKSSREAVVDALGGAKLLPEGTVLHVTVVTKTDKGPAKMPLTKEVAATALSAGLAGEVQSANAKLAQANEAHRKATEEAAAKAREAKIAQDQAEAKRKADAAANEAHRLSQEKQKRDEEKKAAEKRTHEFELHRRAAQRCGADGSKGCQKARDDYTKSVDEAARRTRTGLYANDPDRPPPPLCKVCSESSATAVLNQAVHAQSFFKLAVAAQKAAIANPHIKGFKDPLIAGLKVDGALVRIRPGQSLPALPLPGSQ